MLKLVKENGGVVMVNFYSGFLVPEGARVTRKMFEVARELRKKYPDDGRRTSEALRRVATGERLPGRRPSTPSSTTSTTS